MINMRFENWMDENADYPLEYEFTDIRGNDTTIVLRALQVGESYNTKLSSGKQYIKGRTCDSLGTCT